MNVARLIGVSRRYGRRWALIRASLDVPQGSAALLTGENGAGKTTLLRVLATALSASRGTVEIFGREVRAHREYVRSRLGIVTHMNHLYPGLSARENLKLITRFQPGIDSRRITSILERIGLASRADSPVATFSAGMQRRLCMGRVLLREPDLVLLDEPFGQLDPEGVSLVEEIIRELRTKGVTLVMSTHDVERGRAICDHHVYMSAGRLRGPLRPLECTAGGGET